jgi:hypothetical protein
MFGKRLIIMLGGCLLASSVFTATNGFEQQTTPPAKGDLPSAPIKDADLLQVTAHQDGAATDYVYNYLEGPDRAVWSVVCIGRPGSDSACRVFHKGERAVLYVFHKEQRVRTGRFASAKAIVGKVCGSESGCFAVQITHVEQATGQKKPGK